ncbi:hypothetical protein BSKO_02136 [Bryopsis sp. KO-2023]|nr:hypothetical protein BSKO_02136 [Bryopsis sp. KO-2023]
MSAANDVAQAVEGTLCRVKAAAEKGKRTTLPRLVAVSKTKPNESLQCAYDAGLRTFGENYVQEIIEKAPLLPADIEWHFIGHLQSNKIKKLLEGVPNLAMVETVHSVKVANKLNQTVADLGRPPLGVMVQVNTSGEESKNGIEPKDVNGLAKHIHEECKSLKLAGLMTIGMPDYTSRPENFLALLQCRNEVCKELGLEPDTLEVSMGMSGDFEQAIEMGSTNVRVGSAIFGARDYSK